MSDDIETEVIEEKGVVNVRVTMPRDHGSLDGSSVIEAPVCVADVTVRADDQTVRAVADALRAWCDEQQTDPRGSKPISQRMNEAYDR
jgi:hypothetical protein